MSSELLQHVGQLVIAEMRKLQSRFAARLGWVAMALLGFLPPAFMWLVGDASFEVNGQPQAIDLSAANGVRWALTVRNFYVAQALLLVLGAASVAGEYQQRTLREDLLRPVPRAGVLLAKWVALAGWSAVALAVQWVVAVLAGFVLLSSEGGVSWTDVFAGYLTTFATDVSFASVVLLVSVASRSVSGTIGAMFLFLVLERFAGWMLWVGSQFRASLSPEYVEQIPSGVHVLLSASPYLPSSAWGLSSVVAEGLPVAGETVAALCVITAAAAVGAERVFARVDVP